MKLTPQKTTGI